MWMKIEFWIDLNFPYHALVKKKKKGEEENSKKNHGKMAVESGTGGSFSIIKLRYHSLIMHESP